MGRYGYDYGYSAGRRGIKKSDDPTIKIKPKELGVGALLVGALGSLSGSKNKKQTGKKSDVSAPVSKPKIVETPTSKPKTKSSDKLKSSVKQAVESQDQTTTYKKARPGLDDTVYLKKQDGGKTIPEGPEGAGLRALKAEAPEVTSKMGYKKKGGIVEGINNIKGMKNGGVCRGMGAATKGGSFNVS
jgi:hypothetical protein